MALWTIRTDYDLEAGVWYVAESDIPGLAVDGATFEELAHKAGQHLPDLLDIHRDSLSPAKLSGPHSIQIVAHYEHRFDVAA
jgi:predicted RNase H-like HicB family nuclease